MRPFLAALAAYGALCAQPSAPNFEGNWQGTLDAGAAKLRLAVHITKSAQGGYSSILDSLDQGATGIPVDKTTVDGRTLHLDMPRLRATFAGTLGADGNSIEGKFTQGAALPLTLRRVTTAEAPPARPQTPKPPFPYAVENVSYSNKTAAITLNGTLTLPPGAGPFPAAILITGSGTHDRDETIFGHKPFLVMADYLTRRGIAVLRYDDRPTKAQSTYNDLAGDALAATDYLRTRKEIDPQKIGLIGHSEGGLIAPLAASQSGDVAFIVLLAGTGLPGEDILYLQGQAVLKAQGAPAKVLAEQRAVQEIIFAAVRKEKDNDKVKKLIDEGLKKRLEKKSAEERKELEKQKGLVEAQLQLVLTPWFRYFLTYDPRPALRKVRVPVLALIGEKDVQVPPRENLKAITVALAEGGNKDYTVKELAGLNHLFQTCKTGSLAEYGQSEETFAPSALKLIANWILKQAGRQQP